MTELTSLYKDYIQKSRIFLYPILKIPRGVSVTPIQTYMEWIGKYTRSDCRLICVYHLRNDSDFKKFESRKLLDNERFDNFFKLDDSKGVYIFNFKDLKDDYLKITKGKYSQLSNRYKQKILEFFKHHRAHHAYIESYLYPDKYFTMYSDLLNVKVEVLKEVGELCSKPNFKYDSKDLTTEILDAEIKIMNFDSINLNLPNKPTE